MRFRGTLAAFVLAACGARPAVVEPSATAAPTAASEAPEGAPQARPASTEESPARDVQVRLVSRSPEALVVDVLVVEDFGPCGSWVGDEWRPAEGSCGRVPVANASVQVASAVATLVDGVTSSDGSVRFSVEGGRALDGAVVVVDGRRYDLVGRALVDLERETSAPQAQAPTAPRSRADLESEIRVVSRLLERMRRDERRCALYQRLEATCSEYTTVCPTRRRCGASADCDGVAARRSSECTLPTSERVPEDPIAEAEPRQANSEGGTEDPVAEAEPTSTPSPVVIDHDALRLSDAYSDGVAVIRQMQRAALRPRRRRAETTPQQARTLFRFYVALAFSLRLLEVRPGDSNGAVRAWDEQWGPFLNAPLWEWSVARRRGSHDCVAPEVSALSLGQLEVQELRRGLLSPDEGLDWTLAHGLALQRVVADEAAARRSEGLSCEDLPSDSTARFSPRLNSLLTDPRVTEEMETFIYLVVAFAGEDAVQAGSPRPADTSTIRYRLPSETP